MKALGERKGGEEKCLERGKEEREKKKDGPESSKSQAGSGRGWDALHNLAEGWK